MKNFIILMLTLVLIGSAAAADWIDNGDGTWTIQPDTLTVTTVEKDMYEQIRASHNYKYRDTSNALDASAWLASLFQGITNRDGYVVEKLCAVLWKAFKREWVSQMAMAASVSGGDTEGLAVTVPPPPAP